jgi:hypothetical protein
MTQLSINNIVNYFTIIHILLLSSFHFFLRQLKKMQELIMQSPLVKIGNYLII